MRADGHTSVAPATVGSGELRKYVVRRLDEGQTWAIAAASGAPRLWSYGSTAALHGFESGFADDLRGIPRLQRAVGQARRSFLNACGALIERRMPDVAFLALALDGASIHVVCAGNVRAYVFRGRQSQRITPRVDHESGLLDGRIATASEPLNGGDLVMAGSASAFSTRAVGRVSAVLQGDPQTPPAVIANLLTDPARKAGVGAAAVVLRAR
ncbi:MAG: hypothetical protein AAGE52_39450 [Myxococcota bacterium]